MRTPIACPCGSEQSFQLCCSPFHEGIRFPETAEKLMRSRYSAFAVGNLPYLKETIAGKAALTLDSDNLSQVLNTHQWLGLDIVSSTEDQQNTDHATVEFRALYDNQGKYGLLHERSEFKRINGRWYYVAGVTVKSSRNELCPCHSGKKFKKCHG